LNGSISLFSSFRVLTQWSWLSQIVGVDLRGMNPAMKNYGIVGSERELQVIAFGQIEFVLRVQIEIVSFWKIMKLKAYEILASDSCRNCQPLFK
jgi:hypothetical protein